MSARFGNFRRIGIVATYAYSSALLGIYAVKIAITHENIIGVADIVVGLVEIIGGRINDFI